MADEHSETPKPSWRDRSGGSAGGPPNVPAPPGRTPSEYEWTQRQAQAIERRRLPNAWWLRVAAALLGFLGFAAIAVILILMLQAGPPTALVLVGADYANNLAVPHNIAGVEGLRALEELASKRPLASLFRPARLRLLKKQLPMERASDWKALVEGLRKPGTLKSDESLIMAVALHGLSTADGAYLVPNSATKPEDGLAMGELIESLKLLPATTPKLLVLEPTDVVSDWTQGVLHNDFVSRLKALEPAIAKVSNLWVMCASDSDQRSWTSEGLGRSPFFHYLTEGLKGKAAGPDRRLTLDELFAYVRKNVAGWAWNARDAVQEPLLIPGASSKAASQLDLATVADDTPAKTPAPIETAAMVKAWSTYRELDHLIPHPAVHSPMRWRDYRAALVRFEELTRAGASEKASLLAARLSGLERRIRSERLRDLPSSIGNTLAMNAVRGGLAEVPIPAEFNAFWTGSGDDDLNKTWTAINNQVSADDRTPPIRSRIDKFLIERAVESPMQNLNMVFERLRITEGNELPQPAEAHFVRMAKTYLETERLAPRDWALLGELIALRRRAELSSVSALTGGESGHSYSAQIHAWTKPLIDKADVSRRDAEDLLFANGEQARVEAGHALDQARTTYLQADIAAAKVRAALGVRDRVLSDLPGYSLWVTRLPAAPKDPVTADIGAIEALWAKTHELTALLEKPSAENAEPLASLSVEISKSFDDLKRRFQSQKVAIDLRRVGDDWQTAGAAARVAFDDNETLELRRIIWERLANIRKKDRDLVDRTDLAPPPKDKQVELLRAARLRSIRQGRIALAALGSGWFNNAKFEGKGNFDSLKSEFDKLDAEQQDASNKDDGWRSNIAKAGTLIGERWRGLPQEINALTALDKAIPDLALARATLLQADYNGRMAGPSAFALDDSFREPAGRRRDLLIHDLLKQMANRARLDHWYDEDPAETPYYQRVGKRYLDDAERLVPGSPELVTERDLLKIDAKLALEGPGPLVVTTEQSLAVAYKLVETGPLPPGTPVVKGIGQPLFQIEGEGKTFRSILRPTANQPGQTASFAIAFPSIKDAETDLSKNRPSRDEAIFSAEGFFRGQVFKGLTPITLDPVAEVVAIGPSPFKPLASLAVRADQAVIDRFGEGTGAITFVLDCSGSMVTPAPSKFEEAKKALLAALKIVPRGTQIAIVVFGQADDGFAAEFPRDQDRENNAKPERTIKVLRPPSAWNANQLDALNQQLDALKPFHGTPLVQAMTVAKQQMESVKGAKTMVVLTDGKDTRFVENKEFNPKGADIPTFVRSAFLGSGIRINMAFFKVVEDELKEARAQFAGTIEHLDTPGQFFTINDFGKLVTALQASVRQKLVCQLIDIGSGRLVSEVDVTAPGESDRWLTKGLPPAPYTLRVNAGRTFSRGVSLENGDRLVVQLGLGADGGIVFERAIYGDEARRPKEPVGESAGRQLSILTNRASSEGSRLDIGVSLEPRLTPSGPTDPIAPLPSAGPLKQDPAGFVWFGLEPAEGQGSFQVRFREIPLFPAQVWLLESPLWVNDPAGGTLARPNLTAWWNPGPITYQASLNVESPFSIDHLTLDADDGSKVTIESIRVENHVLITNPGSPPESVSAMVVRLAHPKGKPFLAGPVTLGKTTVERTEHRVFTTSDKTTSIFWPVTQSQVEEGLKRLDFIAVDSFRRQAEANKTTVRLRLNRPRSEDDIPEPPEAIIAP